MVYHTAYVWSFEFSESVRTVSAQRIEGLSTIELNGSVLATSLRYSDGEDMLNRIVTGDELCIGASLAIQLKAYFNALETSQFTFNQKDRSLRLHY
jgi:hypothetical protein